MNQWEIDVLPLRESLDHRAREVLQEAMDLGFSDQLRVRSGRAYLLRGELNGDQVNQLAVELLADPIVERVQVHPLKENATQTHADSKQPQLINVMLKRGVTDTVAYSAQRAIHQMHVPVEEVRTFKKYWIEGASREQISKLCSKVLANDSIEQVTWGPLSAEQIISPPKYAFQLRTISVRDANTEKLAEISRQGHLYLSVAEMQQIQSHFADLGRDPTDVELETIAQTWSEHCSHKTLKGSIEYEDNRHNQKRTFKNLLKQTVFAATQEIRKSLAEKDWCVSVFEDNAGVVKFDEDDHVVFKVETHNHPSAIEPYGGANTGLGGVIRDPLGTGLGAKPICNTDVFCFAPLDTPTVEIPEGVLHPRRVFRGVVAGVRDYGNRMGIPTVNGAIYFDSRYLANPLVYCGTVGLLPVDKVNKAPKIGDLVVVMGGRTGRDGIHGATFSSAELTSDSDELSGGAVQIGNAITEKMLLDVLLSARDLGLFHAVTDCGAGGLSSAVGEMGCELGAEVALDKVPLKYAGLSYTEIWISEAQERMVLAVAPDDWNRLKSLCDSEDVEVTAIGRFTGDGSLRLTYAGAQVADLDMHFLHDGRPEVIRQAIYAPSTITENFKDEPPDTPNIQILKQVLASPNVASKEWVIRQYDHEVQGSSVIKPLVGAANDGPGDAAVLRPKLQSWRGLAVACGMNPRYGDWDPYHMAASAIDEAVRNCVAVGADPQRIAILDNFCWGNTERPETLGTLVRAAVACHDVAVAFGTPFISGKDSLNNEFSFESGSGRTTISIPPTLLISAMGHVHDVRRCVTMDLKQPGNALFIVGETANELRGSHYELITGCSWGNVPCVNLKVAPKTFAAVHQAIQGGLVRACHDLSEGGLATALAEMAFAGMLGADVSLQDIPHCLPDDQRQVPTLLFAESNTRFICEVPPEHAGTFQDQLTALGIPCALIGTVTEEPRLRIREQQPSMMVIDAACDQLKIAWQTTLAT